MYSYQKYAYFSKFLELQFLLKTDSATQTEHKNRLENILQWKLQKLSEINWGSTGALLGLYWVCTGSARHPVYWLLQLKEFRVLRQAYRVCKGQAQNSSTLQILEFSLIICFVPSTRSILNIYLYIWYAVRQPIDLFGTRVCCERKQV